MITGRFRIQFTDGHARDVTIDGETRLDKGFFLIVGPPLGAPTPEFGVEAETINIDQIATLTDESGTVYTPSRGEVGTLVQVADSEVIAMGRRWLERAPFVPPTALDSSISGNVSVESLVGKMLSSAPNSVREEAKVTENERALAQAEADADAQRASAEAESNAQMASAAALASSVSTAPVTAVTPETDSGVALTSAIFTEPVLTGITDEPVLTGFADEPPPPPPPSHSDAATVTEGLVVTTEDNHGIGL